MERMKRRMLSWTVQVKWMMSKGLGGVMAWALDLDDFTGHCGAGSYPLLRAVNLALGVPLRNHTVTLGSTAHSLRPRPGPHRPPPPPRHGHRGKAVHRPRRPAAPPRRLTTSLPVVSSTEHDSQHQQQEHEQERKQQLEKSTAMTLLSATNAQG